MVEVTKYECDVTGEMHGKREVHEYELWHRRGDNPFDIAKRTIHLSEETLEDTELKPHYHLPSSYRVAYIGVEQGEITGMMFAPNNDGGGIVHGWHERDSVVTDHYIPFYEYLEEEVIY